MNIKSKLQFIFAVLVIGMCFVSTAVAGTSHAKRQSGTAAAQNALTGSSSTLMPDGRLLVVGGQDKDANVKATLSVKNSLTGELDTVGATLKYPRAWHTATVLPDGTVLILGGLGQDGKVVSSAELFDPLTQTVETITAIKFTPRAFHTTTVLTSGLVLVAGGVSDKGASMESFELWDFRKNETSLLASGAVGRNRQATLLSDGRVLFSGGKDENGKTLLTGLVFDPQTRVVMPVADPAALLASPKVMTEVRASSPEDHAENVPIDALISMRFSRPILMSSINAQTIAFTGPDGDVASKIVAAEGGMLAFLSPSFPLVSGTSYVVKLAGALDTNDQSVAFAEFGFSTAGQAPFAAGAGPEDWTPTSDWQTHRGPSKFESLPDLQASKSETALAGQVLRLNGMPLENVTLQISGTQTRTDETGRFLLKGIPQGHQVLVIDGRSADGAGKTYGLFEYGAEIQPGVTNQLGFKIWMPALDLAHEVTIPSPTTKETIITTPLIPGLELRLPPGTVITDHEGRAATTVSITPIPLDRTPFPLPFVKVPVYFTIQPGGAYLRVQNNEYKGAQLIYPNSGNLDPGIPFAFWNYNPDHNGWYVYGNGHVSKDRAQIVPDPGVVIYGFSGAMVGTTGGMPNTQSTSPKPDGDPVNLSSGLFIYNKTDLTVPDVIPLTLSRTYRPNDSWSRPFGIGTSHPYEMFVGGDGHTFGTTAYVDMALPDGSRIHLIGNGAGPSYSSYINTSGGTPWYGAVLSGYPRNPNGYTLPGSWQLQTRDGTIYSFPSSDGLTNPPCQALIAITDRYGNQVKITRTAYPACTISQITSPSGRYIQFQYDTSNRITSATDNTGRTVQYTYDGSGRLSTVTDANNGVWTYTYDSSNRMLTIKDPRQITYLTNQYDSAGRVTKQTQADNSTYQFSWTATASPSNNTFFVTTGGSGPQPYQILQFRFCSACQEYYASLISQVDVTDPNGNVRRVVFNSSGYPTTDTHALGKSEQQTTTYTYFSDNLVATKTDQLGRVTSYAYDANANLTQMTRLSGTSNAVTTTLTYDATFSNLTSATDPLSHTTSFGYDALGNLTTVIDPLGHTSTLSYSSNGQPVSYTDPLGNATQFAYDSGDLINVTDPLQRTTYLFHDGVGRLTTRLDPLAHSTQYQYNALNQVTQITDPVGNQTAFTYDANGNLLTVTDAKNHTTTYTYDNMDRLATRKDALLNQESDQYDSNGNLNQFTDRRGKVTKFTYDGLNRMTFAGYGWTSGTNYESTVTNTFDGGNRLTQSVDSISGTITRGYDGLDRLTSETTPGSNTVSYTYDNADRRASLTVPGQSVVNYTFDNANRLTQIAQGSNTVSISYDNANRRTTLTLPNGITTSYSYDNASELTGLTYANGSTNLGNLTYSYDLVGRRMNVGGSYARTGLPNAVSATAYNANNQLTTWGSATLSYDANGNMTSDGTHSYTWDTRSHLKQIDSGTTASFIYDPFGRRTSKTISSTQTGFLYDGANPVQELSGTTVTANSLLGGVDEVFQRTDSAGTRNFLTDALGGTIALTDSSAAFQTTYTFDPFGNASLTGSSTTNSFAYTGRELDASGLDFYRARYYDPAIGRFISEDPLQFGGGINFYAYVANDPVNLSDPFGLGPNTPQSQQIQNQLIQQLQNIFPGSTYNETTNTLVIPLSTTVVQNTLVNQGYQQPGQWWNHFLYWDPIVHAGGDEYRTGTQTFSFHFRQRYPPCGVADACSDLPIPTVGRKTILDQFHMDSSNPAVDPVGHIIHDFLHIPRDLPWVPIYPWTT